MDLLTASNSILRLGKPMGSLEAGLANSRASMRKKVNTTLHENKASGTYIACSYVDWWGGMWGRKIAYLVIIYDPVGINFTARGATPELLNDWYAEVDFAPYIMVFKG